MERKEIKFTKAAKKGIIIASAAILLALCIAGACWAGRHCTMDWENGILTVREGFWSGYSYKVYKDHAELVEYTGNKEKVRVPDRLMGKPVTVIKELCFLYKREIKTVHLGRNIRVIERNAFFDCVSLEEVTGDAELEVISIMTFGACHRLKKVDVGNRIKRIEEFAFSHCRELESIGEQPELEYIGEYAFKDAGSLPNFQVPEDTVVGRRAFGDSRWLENRMQENLEEFIVLGAGTLVSYCGDAEVVEIPYGVAVVDTGVFDHNENAEDIREIYLPETVKKIESWAFDGCNGIRVYMPDSVTTLESSRLDWVADDQSLLIHEGMEMSIVTTSGSYAEEYAKKYNVDYEIVEPWW